MLAQLTDRQSALTRLHQAAEGCKSGGLTERCQGRQGVLRFHSSRIMEPKESIDLPGVRRQ
jgi:hypothetical protein